MIICVVRHKWNRDTWKTCAKEEARKRSGHDNRTSEREIGIFEIVLPGHGFFNTSSADERETNGRKWLQD